MEQADLLKTLVGALEKLGVPYLLTGALATSAFGEPRFTQAIDVVVRLTLAQVPHLCAAFACSGRFLRLPGFRAAGLDQSGARSPCLLLLD